MTITRRLRTIERKLNISNSNFCRCYGDNLKYEVIPITIDEWKRRFDTGKEREERLPDFCERCRKPVDKRNIQTTFEQWQKAQGRRINEVIERVSRRAER